MWAWGQHYSGWHSYKASSVRAVTNSLAPWVKYAACVTGKQLASPTHIVIVRNRAADMVLWK